MYKMLESSDNDGLDPVRRKLPILIHKGAGLYDRQPALSPVRWRSVPEKNKKIGKTRRKKLL